MGGGGGAISCGCTPSAVADGGIFGFWVKYILWFILVKNEFFLNPQNG